MDDWVPDRDLHLAITPCLSRGAALILDAAVLLPPFANAASGNDMIELDGDSPRSFGWKDFSGSNVPMSNSKPEPISSMKSGVEVLT